MKNVQLEIVWPGDGEERKQPKLYNAKEQLMDYRAEFICPQTYNIYVVTHAYMVRKVQ